MNDLVIAGDRESGEEYLARIVDGDAHGHDPPPRPIVMILRAVRYPNQRAFAHPDRPMELPAIRAGTLCRMEILREPTEAERALLFMMEADALGRAIRKAMRETDSEGEREILRRHAKGEIGRGRVMLTFRKSDIDWLKSLTGTNTENRPLCRSEAHGIPEDMDELPGGH